jgi:hypothetical protein
VARIQALAQLRRLSHLSTIRRAVAPSRPLTTANIGLVDVATACRIRGVGKWATHDDLLTIACEWDLARDQLDDQSDACLAAIARILRLW